MVVVAFVDLSKSPNYSLGQQLQGWQVLSKICRMFKPLPPYSPALNHRDLFWILFFPSLVTPSVKCPLVMMIDHRLPLPHAVLALFRSMNFPDPNRPLHFSGCQTVIYTHSSEFAITIKQHPSGFQLTIIFKRVKPWLYNGDRNSKQYLVSLRKRYTHYNVGGYHQH